MKNATLKLRLLPTKESKQWALKNPDLEVILFDIQKARLEVCSVTRAITDEREHKLIFLPDKVKLIKIGMSEQKARKAEDSAT